MASSRELAEKAFSLLQDALQDSESRAAGLDAELRKKRAPKNKIEHQAQVLEHRLETVEAEREQWKREAAQLAEILENERAKLQSLKKKLQIAESGPDKIGKKEINYWRSRAEQFDDATRQYKQRIAELRKSLKERPVAEIDSEEVEQLRSEAAEAEQLRTQAAEVDRLRAEVAEVERLRAEAAGVEQLRAEAAEAGRLRAEAERLKAAVDDAHEARQQAEELVRARDAELAELKAQASNLNTTLEQLRSENSRLNSDLADKTTELTDQAGQINARRIEIADKDRALTERDRRISELAEARRTAEEEKRAIRDQIAGLEEELKEEKECTVNLSEVANERREQITELSEKLDEAQERYEEAKWHLERAGRFERLVVKRHKLVDSLIEGIRAKQKSNTALKAGLDGLRKFKAKSEQQQQKLLIRVEELTAELKEAEERLANRKGSKDSDDKLRKAGKMIEGLEERLDAQVQVIENLENELSAVKASRQSAENQNRELNELKATLEIRNETIAKLEADLDDQQKQLGKLRGSESETMRLKAVQMKDQTLIDELQAEIDGLRAELAQQQKIAEGGAESAATAATAEIRKRDAQLSDLKRTIKDQEKEIAKLNEAVSGWQKKYEFLSTEAPSAYQSVAAEK